MEEKKTCLRPGLGCWVIIWLFVATICLVLSYSIARSTGHTESPFVPAISETTSKDPEGAIFAELFNITAMLTLVIMGIRYFQVRMINRQVEAGETSHLTQINSLGIVFGFCSVLGITIVANFRSIQADDAIQIIHVTGAVLLFASGAAYCWAQTLATYQLTKFNSDSRPTFTVRLVISSVITLSTVVFFICGGLTYHASVKASSWHVVGNLAEWITAWCFGAFALSFFKEFQKLSLNIQCIPRCGGSSSDALKYSTIPLSGIDENTTDSE